MSKKDYPKMLYQGNLQVFKTAIAENEDHESELKEQNWIEYGELPEASSGPTPKNIVENSLIPTEQFDALASKVVELEEENIRLKGVIEKGSSENADLREQLTFFQNEGPKLTASAGDQLAKDPTDYNDLKIDELQALLDQKGIKYLKRDGKDTLIGLLNGHSN